MLETLISIQKLITLRRKYPSLFASLIDHIPIRINAEDFLSNFRNKGEKPIVSSTPETNIIQEYFKSNETGPGIWKWNHYFEIYKTHFTKFVGSSTNILEIGIYSGGSLGMWRSFLGEQCHVYGIDIEDACKSYENEYTTIFIGDQADRLFWEHFRKNSSPIDILVDDGGHTTEQQRVTLEEMLPYLRDGGVYVCEDIHGISNAFMTYATRLVEELNHLGTLNNFQKSVHSIHFYPFCFVIEKHTNKPEHFDAPKMGSNWQPFFEKKP